MNGTLRDTVVESAQYKHDDACPLFNPRHTIPQPVADVIEAFDSMDGCRAVAAGCNTCSSHALAADDDVDAYVYYVAQNSSDGGVYFGFGGDADAEAVAYQLIGCAVEEGVDYEWTGDTSKKVLINPQ